MSMNRTVVGRSCAMLAIGWGTLAWAQADTVREDDAPGWLRQIVQDQESPQAREYARQRKVRKELEREIRKLRFEHFRTKNTALRQEGMLKLREYTDPAVFPLLIEIFERDDAQVRLAILDHIMDTATDEGDTTLAWVGVFDKDEAMRKAAIDRLRTRIAKVGQAPYNVRLVVYQGLRSKQNATMASAANLANMINLAEAIPWLIASQVTGSPQGGGGGAGQDQSGYLAYIAIGRQVAFVSDLTPVVGEGAVAFDPQLSVVNEGVLLRISGATVYSYHTEVHGSLVDLSTRLSGESTRDMGWNVPAWQRWYAQTFAPAWEAKQREAKAAEAKTAAEPQ